MKKVLILFIAILIGGFTAAQDFDIQILNAAALYQQGDAAKVLVRVGLQNSKLEFDNAVVFLNVVEIDKARKYPQAAHKIFETAKIDKDVFKRVYTKADLLAGIEANIDFSFKNNAKPAQYAIVIQVFEGRNTNPHRLAGKHRIGFGAHKFDLIAK